MNFREVVQEGYNPAGNKWIRNERGKTKDDFPSPKRQKMDNAGEQQF